MNETKHANLFHYIVVMAFCLFFRFLPGPAGITPMGMGLLGVFIGAVYGWIFIDMLWPSLMGLLGAGLTIGMGKMLGWKLWHRQRHDAGFLHDRRRPCHEDGRFRLVG